MELIRGLHNISEAHRGCVLTIGKFDGVHLGHRAVLAQLIERAKALNVASAVMVFEPQPEEVFNPQAAPARLSRLRDKYIALRDLGIDRLICVRFNATFAAMTPQAFIQDLLINKLGIAFLVVGDDFKFGNKRSGDFQMLQQASRQHGFSLASMQSFMLADCRISSTQVRDALQADNFALARSMLGRDFSISGRVVHGDAKGRTIGFPTANVLLKRCQSPVGGVFAVQVVLANQILNGVANIGTRPTVNGVRSQLEVHIFDFNQDIYGQFVEVKILAKIRDEVKFASFTELQAQIQLDAAQARDVLAQLHI